jgi:small-conductance mechanosensitive channel
VAEPDLIADYLRSLRDCLRSRPDAADLVDEAEDHLRLSTERIARECGDALQAQRITLTRFGDPAVVARAFATAGGLTMPTPFTRAAGKVAVLAALGWLVLAVVGAYSTGAITPYSESTYAWSSVVATATVAATAVALIGMLVRAGERFGPWMFAAVALSSLSLVAAALVTWGIVVWALLIWLACSIALGRMRAVGGATRPLDWALLAAWPVSLGLWLLVERLQLGPLDSYGDYPAASATGIAVLGVLMAAGLASIGLRLAAEVPADLPRQSAPAAPA